MKQLGFMGGFVFAAVLALASPVLAAGITVGVSWADSTSARWRFDEAAIKSALDSAGASYLGTNAHASDIRQLNDINHLVAAGVDALIVQPQDPVKLETLLASVIRRGIPVISYDRLIETPQILYLSFSNREVGRMQARAILAAQPKGNYAFIKGDPTDPNADFLFDGQIDVLVDALASGDIVNIGDVYTKRWAADVAKRQMQLLLDENDNNIDAVIGSSDLIAGGVIAALAERGLAGRVPVSGQDADPEALNRIALGTQTVSVWKDTRQLGRKAGEFAVLLAEGGTIDDIPDIVRFNGGSRGVEVNSYFLAPTLITRETLDIVIDSGWATRETVCKDVAPGTVAICD